MYTDLFSSLDGAYSVIYWLPALSLILLLTSSYYIGNMMSTVVFLVSSLWGAQTLSRFNPFKLFLSSLMLLLLVNNFLGLSPFTYALTSDLFSMSSLALLVWLLMVLSGWMYSPLQSAAHLLPSGAPLALAPFLVLIESVSILIRPLTLTVRLMANISAGHIVLGLLANTLTAFWGTLMMVPLVMLNVGYMLFEFFVCVIQAYIFTLLLSLYQAEHP